MERLPIAAQVYSVRDAAATDFDGTMEQLSGMGYEGVELAGLYGKSSREIRDCLDKCGMQAVSAHVPLDELIKDLDGTVETYKEIGCRFLVIPWLDQETWYGGSGYPKLLDRIPEIAARCRQEGIQLLYHNHAFEFEKTPEGGFQLDAFYKDPRTEGLAAELDLCWVKVGGADPAEYLKKYSGRCPVVHVKDFVREDQITLVAVGDGELEVEAVLRQAGESGASWLVVEQDDHKYGSPMENMKKSIDCIRSIMNR